MNQSPQPTSGISTPCKFGAQRDDGKYFIHTRTSGVEYWAGFDVYHDQKINNIRSTAKDRCRKLGIKFGLTSTHLRDIFPADFLCPVLGIEMEWGKASGLSNSPSLDRKIPELGYVDHNVCWISNRANSIKYNASADELSRVLAYVKDCESERIRN